MPIKLVVTDLDGTLLRGDKTVSDRTQRALKALKAKGILFTIATARPIRAVDEWLSFLTFDAAIYHNGAVIRDFSGDLHSVGIENAAALVAPILAEQPDAQISIESDDTHFANFAADELWPGMEFVRTADFHEVTAPADKLIIRASTPEEMQRFQKYIPESLYMQLSENVIAMVMRREATKLNGIRLLSAQLGIGLDEVAAFGDDANDAEMLRGCGKGLAMRNAAPEIQSCADEVIADCDADGVARWIEANLL